ncbi:Uncharacterised protein [Chlamydia trachomatis]|nr:Uncharacterised protein [Chlamydia trachomatis]
MRTTTPSSDIIIISSSSSTILQSTSRPFFAVILIVNTPCPPRCCSGYSSTRVRLPYPCSVITSSDAPSWAISRHKACAPAESVIPFTPIVPRPKGRASDSSHLITLPALVAIITLSPGETRFTAISVSSSFKLMAIRPSLRVRS